MKSTYIKDAEVYKITDGDYTGIVLVKSGYIIQIDNRWNRFYDNIFGGFLYWLADTVGRKVTIERIK